MRYAVLGDVHSNLEALEAVVNLLRSRNVDAWLQLGDVVGYGADPGPCIQVLRDLDAHIVAGNHDWAVIGMLDLGCFNPAARAAVEWTRGVISQEETRWLESLPLRTVVDTDITLVHATPHQPELFEYIFSFEDAELAFAEFSTRLCFIGHSHVPMALELKPGGVLEAGPADRILLQESQQALINVGSVGQPRDGDPRAACGIYDDATGVFELLRVPYDVGRAAAKIREAGLPAILANRIFVGE